MSAYLGTEPVFILEGSNGSCELWTDELGYQLFFEGPGSYKPEVISQYANRINAVEDAFEDAKRFTGLEDWKMTLEDISLHQALDDILEWDNMVEYLRSM